MGILAATYGLRVLRCFFGTAHGKGTHDSEGGVVKGGVGRELVREDGAALFNARQVAAWCSQHLGTPASATSTSEAKRSKAVINERVFHHVSAAEYEAAVQELSRKHVIQVKGTRALHELRFTLSPRWTKARCMHATHLVHALGVCQRVM